MTQTNAAVPTREQTSKSLARKYMRQFNREVGEAKVTEAHWEAMAGADEVLNRVWVAYDNGNATLEELDAACKVWMQSWRAVLA